MKLVHATVLKAVLLFPLLSSLPLFTAAECAEPPNPGYTIPIVDLANETNRQVIVDREKGQYLGHPTTVLLEDGKTILCVYPKGHGRGAVVYKKSTDGGLTWSERLPTPKNWETSLEVPTIHRVVDTDATKRLIMWSGLYPARLAVSEDDGESWSELKPVGDWGGIVVMGSVVELKTAPGNYMAMFHDDGRFFTENNKRTSTMTLLKTFSEDGGLTWSYPEAILAESDVHHCEPGIIRSPDGKQLAALLRENARKKNSHVIFSNDEGKTWSEPRELPGSLTGDRHTAKYAPDGRLFISFRDTTRKSPTQGDWVGWVGTYKDIVEGNEGQYRVRLMDNKHRWDCAYPGVEILPDGTFVTTTYGYWTEGEQPYIVSVRFTLDELDQRAAQMAADADKPHVLLIGDSISQGYTAFVKEFLKDEAVVERIYDRKVGHNGQHTGTGLARLDQWLGITDWDVIHFNWGLWDLCYRHPDAKDYGNRDKINGTLTTTLEQYETNLRELVGRLKQTGAKLIWASTTPVPEGEAGRKHGDAKRFNAVAKRIMQENGIPIDDLYAHIQPHVSSYQSRPGDVHFTKAGSEFLAASVADSIRTSLAVGSAKPENNDQTNIVLFLVDDMGWQDTSVPFHTKRTPFNDRYRTPNMERLAASGMKFTNAYASAPVCTPTRTSIMTGQSPGQTHITFWTLHKDRDTSKNHSKLSPPAWKMNGLQEDDITLPKLLKNAGYTTIHAGKAHFGTHDTSGSDPTNLGFDVNIAGHASGAPGSYYGIHNFANEKREGGPTKKTVWDVPGLEKYHGKDIYLTEALSIEVSNAVTNAVKSDKPFFLYFAPYAIHTPIMANNKYLEKYKDLHPREAAYATMIESMDAALGSVLDTLDELEIADNTIIIFSSDNGGLSAHARGGKPHTHNAPLKSGKGSAYEGGTRAPTIIHWPGVTESRSVSDVPIISHDFFPTILSIAGVDIPSEYSSKVEGRDITPLLKQQDEFVEARPLFWHQPHQWGASGPGIHPFTSVRQGDWKLIYFHADQNFELFNLKIDLGEENDLATAEPERVKQLAEIMSRWIENNNVQLSIDKTTGSPIALPRDIANRD